MKDILAIAVKAANNPGLGGFVQEVILRDNGFSLTIDWQDKVITIETLECYETLEGYVNR